MATRKRRGNGAMEENTLAILDNSCFSKGSQHLSDDRLAFLEAVRSGSIVPENGSAPTNKMYEAIFQILKDEKSLDLIMASYQLLNELEKCFPRVHLSIAEKAESSSQSTSPLELVVVEEAWSPFTFRPDFSSSEKQEADNKSESLDATAFQLLIQDLAKVADEVNFEALDTKLLRNMLLLQYLVNVLEGDLLPRNCEFKKKMNWNVLRESLLNMLLGSRRIIYKGLIKDCLSAICEMSHFPTNSSYDMGSPEQSSAEVLEKCDPALAIALPEIEKCTCIALQKLLWMIMELDSSKKIADMEGLTTRADGIRTPTAEIILDELTYNRDVLFAFFQVFDEPKWKLDIIVQYLQKYIPKSSVRTRRSSGSTDNVTFGGVLKCFSNSNSTKSIIKKITSEVAQVLLAHAFQAYLSLQSQHSVDSICDSTEDVESNSLVEICKNLISAFTCLKGADEHTEIMPFGKAALFTAATILSRRS